MKKLLLLPLLLAACGLQPSLPVTEIAFAQSKDYTFSIGPTTSGVEVKPGHVGTQFCYTDNRLAGVQVCNNLSTGKRTVQTGNDYAAVFSVPDEQPAN